jgi:osmoprotectant transport system permease protein
LLLLAAVELPLVVVGSKNFTESTLQAEIFAVALEERAGVRVERRLDLGGTLICFSALEAGALDVYPEYTGTGAVAVLGAVPPRDPLEAWLQVRRAFAERFALAWLPPLGCENTYALAVRAELARRLGLRTISDLALHAGDLSLAASAEFLAREDGLPGLGHAYGLAFGRVVGMSHELAYEAIREAKVDVVDAYTTDPEVARDGLVLLEDDRRFFPPYHAAPLARAALLERLPRVRATLEALPGHLTTEKMRALNARVLAGEEPRAVARSFLEAEGLLGESDRRTPRVAPAPTGAVARDLARWLGQHVLLSGLALLAAASVAIPAGIALARRERLSALVLGALGVLQTIPSLALLGLLLPLLGIGFLPALAALFLYALLPIARGTVVGLRAVDPVLLEAATGLGLTRGQLLRFVELPLALESILGGVRTSAVIAVGTATLAAFIGAGGLGEPIFAGLKLARTDLILEGAIPAALLAVLVDLGLGRLERRLRPGARARARTSPSRP